MEKKFYEIPEVEVIDVMMENSLLTVSIPEDSDIPQVIDGEAGTDDLG